MIKKILYSSLITTLSFSCGYLPFVDYLIAADFSPVGYVVDEDKPSPDAVSIKGEAWVPNKRRSRKLGVFWSTIKVETPPYSSPIDLEKCEVSLVQGDYLAKGRLSILDSTAGPNRYLYTLKADFEYDKQVFDMFIEHRLKVSLKMKDTGINLSNLYYQP